MIETWIEVQLLMTLQEYAPDKGRLFKFTIETPSTVEEVVRQLNLPEDSIIATVNGKTAQLDTPLEHGDNLKFLPLLAGG